MAHAAHGAGKLPDAEDLAGRALALEPANSQAHLLTGVIAGKTGRNALALTHLARVLEANPESFEALFWLSMLHRKQNELDQALDFAQRAVQIRPMDAHSHNSLGLCYLAMLRLDEAATEFTRALELLPNQAPVYHNLGTALYLLGRDMDAAKAFDRALLISPQSIDSFLSLAQVLLSQSNPAEAAKCARRALALNPSSAEAHLILASALVEDSKTGEAEGHLRRAVELNPESAASHALLGQRFQSLGKFEEANAHLAKSREVEPKQGFAYFAYVYNNKIKEEDRPLVEQMEQLVADGGIDPRQTLFLHYGLGRAYEALKEFEKAMLAFDAANKLARNLKFGNQVFDREGYSRRFDLLIDTFNRDFIVKNRRSGCPSALPVLIVGMMRTGTTLCEQILSCHPKIGAAGEQRFWPHAVRPLMEPRFGVDSVSVLPKKGADYVRLLGEIAPGPLKVTDKNPGNYEFLGPIHLALPNCRIIHMRRNPVDTCISIYMTPNRVHVDFAYDRANIVFAYQQYMRLIEHWRSVLPPDRFVEVNYEDLVADRETQARRMLDLIGLDWDDALLHHEQNERNVMTPSLWQVRQPMYTPSVERWRRYKPWLGAFAELL